MQLVILSIFISLFVFTDRMSEKRSLSKYVAMLYLLWWFIWLELSFNGNETMIKVENGTYLILILNVVSFIGIYLLATKYMKDKDEKRTIIKKEKIYIDIKEYQSGAIVWAVGIITMMILLLYLKRYNLLLEQYGINYARIIRFELGYMLKSPFELLLYNYIIQSLLSIISILVVVHILNRKFRNPIIYIGLINILLNAQIGKGRMIIFELLLYFILGFLVYFHADIWKYIKRYWKILMAIIGIGGIAMIVLTLVRLNTNFSDINSIGQNLKETFDQVILYFTGSIRAFDYSITNNYRNIIISQQGNTWGAATFSGINELIVMGIRAIGIKIPTINMTLGALTQPAIFIGESVQYNAFYTAAFNYYVDFGIMGVVLFAGIFGGFIAFIINKALKTKDAYYIMILIFNLYIMLFSLLRWEYQAPATWFVIFIILFVGFVHKRYIVNSKSKNKMNIIQKQNRKILKSIMSIYNWFLEK